MFLGIEIGGTKLQLGVGPGDGTIVALERAKVDAAAGAERIRQQIIELVPVLLSRADLSHADIRAVGIGFGGPVDAERGVVTKSHQIEGWAGFPLADWSRRELGLPTVVHNDADTAGLAEACFGAGRGHSPIFYITIGSGIGGGLIIDQKIYRGAAIGASELGHLLIPKPSDLLAAEFGNRAEVRFPATIESVCSGWGIAKRMQKRLTVMNQCRLTLHCFREGQKRVREADALLAVAGIDTLELPSSLERITTDVIADAARSGNQLAQVHLQATWRILGWSIGQMITLLCPRRIVIGGGVSLMGELLLFEPLRREVAQFVFPPFADCYDIVPAALGEAVVVHGALRLARDMATQLPKNN